MPPPRALAAVGAPLLTAAAPAARAQARKDYRRDAEAIEELIAASCAYLDRLPKGEVSISSGCSRRPSAMAGNCCGMPNVGRPASRIRTPFPAALSLTARRSFRAMPAWAASRTARCSAGDETRIPRFDAAMQQARESEPVILDLTDTPGGGDTVVARAILGWFVSGTRACQIHRLMLEERRTGVPRQGAEQGLPRPGRRHRGPDRGPVHVRVGRWTGSMGEGLAVGLDALGATVAGCPMAGLPGAFHDVRLDAPGLGLKRPAGRLCSVKGVPREAFRCPADTSTGAPAG